MKACRLIVWIAAMWLSINLAYAAPSLSDLLINFQSFQAHFVETMMVQGQQQRSSGTVAIARPNQFRWQVTAPNPQLFVADGKQLWQYEPDLEQVTVSPLNDQLAMQSPLLLLSGQTQKLYSLYQVKQISDNRFLLIPKDQNSLIHSITLVFSQGILAGLIIHNGLDQTTVIEFSMVKMNQPMDASLFQFTPPPDVDVLQG